MSNTYHYGSPTGGGFWCGLCGRWVTGYSHVCHTWNPYPNYYPSPAPNVGGVMPPLPTPPLPPAPEDVEDVLREAWLLIHKVIKGKVNADQSRVTLALQLINTSLKLDPPWIPDLGEEDGSSTTST